MASGNRLEESRGYSESGSVEEGTLPHRKVGPRRRLYLEDVLAYKARLDTQRQQALQALAGDLQALGLD